MDNWPYRSHLLAPSWEAAAKMTTLFSVAVVVIQNLPNTTLGDVAAVVVAIGASVGILGIDRFHRGNGILGGDSDE